MLTFPRVPAIAFVVVAILSVLPANVHAQVTTATLYGVVQDTSGAILPGVSVTVTHQGTNLTRETVSDERGEFALPALPAGPYAIRIELSGFKTYTSQGLKLGAGQEVRQTYALEVGALAETVTVTESAPLVQAASTAQIQTMGAEVTEIPVSRRNLQNVVLLGSGISSTDQAGGGGRAFRVNGVGDGGSAITVDGSSAQTNPENRGFGNYGGQNQIEILSVEAVAEVQVVKGVLAAEYRRFDRRAGQHDHAIGDQPVPRIAAGKLPERSVLVEKSVFAGHDPQTKHHVQPVRRIVGRAHPAEPGLVLHQL